MDARGYNDGPPARVQASMAGDATNGTVVLFGGQEFHHSFTRFGDTWIWDGRSGTWANVTPAVGPVPRMQAFMAYHAVTKKVVMFGGNDGSQMFGEGRQDTWSWNGSNRTWTKHAPQARPCRRDQGAMAYHAVSRTAVIFGGDGDGPCPSTTTPLVQDTWAWDGVDWTRAA